MPFFFRSSAIFSPVVIGVLVSEQMPGRNAFLAAVDIYCSVCVINENSMERAFCKL